MWCSWVMLCFFVALVQGQSQPEFGNADVIKLLRAGFGEAVLIEAIGLNQARFDTSSEGLAALREAGASEKVIAALLGKASDPQPGEDPGINMLEPGVYARTEGGYTLLEPEVLNCCGYLMAHTVDPPPGARGFETVRAELTAEVAGLHSRSVIAAAAEFVVVCPSGSDCYDYQLLQAEVKREAREFGIEALVSDGLVIGLEGILSTRKGALRRVPFEREAVSERAFRLRVPGLPRGEYGFLSPPRLGEPGVAPISRIHTFSIR